MANLYEILGIEKTATKVQIRKAYLRLAKKHHPDKGGDKKAFQDIQNAYEALMDAERRRKYDNSGEANKNAQSFDVRFVEYVYGQVSALAVNKRYDDNLLETIKNATYLLITAKEDSIKDAQSQICSVSKERGKFNLNGEGDNVFANVIEQKIKDLEASIQQTAREIEMYRGFYKLLNDYFYGEQPSIVIRDFKRETEEYAAGLYNDLIKSPSYQRNGAISGDEVRRHCAYCSKDFRYSVEDGAIEVTHISGEKARTQAINIV